VVIHASPAGHTSTAPFDDSLIRRRLFSCRGCRCRLRSTWSSERASGPASLAWAISSKLELAAFLASVEQHLTSRRS